MLFQCITCFYLTNFMYPQKCYFLRILLKTITGWEKHYLLVDNKIWPLAMFLYISTLVLHTPDTHTHKLYTLNIIIIQFDSNSWTTFTIMII